MLKRLVTAALVLASVGSTAAQQKRDPIDRIRDADLRRDLFALAGDEMRGREGGTLDAMTAPAFDPAFKLERCRDFTGEYCGGR